MSEPPACSCPRGLGVGTWPLPPTVTMADGGDFQRTPAAMLLVDLVQVTQAVTCPVASSISSSVAAGRCTWVCWVGCMRSMTPLDGVDTLWILLVWLSFVDLVRD